MDDSFGRHQDFNSVVQRIFRLRWSLRASLRLRMTSIRDDVAVHRPSSISHFPSPVFHLRSSTVHRPSS